MSVPVPGAPPRFSRAGAATGLSFLDSALRLNYVRRLTERLTVVAHGSLQRTTEVDISLRMLDEGQRRAAEAFRTIRGNGGPPPVDAPATIWVPVSRIPRDAAVPIDVRNAAGERLPLLTHHDLGTALASGMYRLLYGILAGHADAHGGSLLTELLYETNEARWLIQLAMASLLTDEHRPEPGENGAGRTAVAGQGARYRQLALKALDEYQDELADYFALLDVAVNDHLLVVPLDANHEEHLVTYAMPLHAQRDPGDRWRIGHILRTSADGYRLSYDSQISSSVRSYQLVVETDPGLQIERMFLSTDADRRLVDELHDDLRVLAERLAAHDPGRRAAGKILELQMQTTLRKLADLVRRREWEADHVGVSLGATLPSCSRLAYVAVSGEGIESDDHEIDSSILRHRRLTPDALRTAADELRGREAHRDISIERAPTSHRAHAQWRSRGPDTGHQINLHAAMLLRDTTAAGPRSVRLYAVTVAALGYVVACFLTGGRLWPFGADATAALGDIDDADAVIAVLLLVPGFLYTRLSLPDHHSVAGQLRALSRLVANLCVVAAAVAAAAIAAGTPGQFVRATLAALVAVPLLGSAALLVRRRPRGEVSELVRLGAPRWLAVTTADAVRVPTRFSSIGSGT